MSTWKDSTLNVFFYFRLGNSLSKPDHFHYCSLNYQEGNNGRLKYIPSHLYEAEDHYKLALNEFSSSKLPSRNDGEMRITVISDTHDRHYLLNSLPECDILIHAGDILMTSRKYSRAGAYENFQNFNEWLGQQPARHKIIIGGNHDKLLQKLSKSELNELFSNGTYLCNELLEIEGLRIFGTPLSRGDSGNQAFQSKEFATATQNILSQYTPGSIDILITHGTCTSLRHMIQPNVMHVSGHSHYHYGVHCSHQSHSDDSKEIDQGVHTTLNVCGPLMDHRYNPSHLPLIVDCHFQRAHSSHPHDHEKDPQLK